MRETDGSVIHEALVGIESHKNSSSRLQRVDVAKYYKT